MQCGYARVNTTDQDCEVEVSSLKDAGCEAVRSAQVSGASRRRHTELAMLSKFRFLLVENDGIVIDGDILKFFVHLCAPLMPSYLCH